MRVELQRTAVSSWVADSNCTVRPLKLHETTEDSVALRMKSECLNILSQSLKHKFWPLLTWPASIPVHTTRHLLVGPFLSPFMSLGAFLPPGLCMYPSIYLEFFSIPPSSTQLLSRPSVPPSGKPPFQVNSCWRPPCLPHSYNLCLLGD